MSDKEPWLYRQLTTRQKLLFTAVMVPMVWAALTAYLFFLEGELLPEAALSAFLPFAWALGGGLAGYLFGEWLAKRKR